MTIRNKNILSFIRNKTRKDRGMVFYWIIGLIAILFILSESILYRLRNEILQSNLIMRAEIVNSVCDAMIEEAFMEIRTKMNDHTKVSDSASPYNVLRCGWGNTNPPPITVQTPLAAALAKKHHFMDTKNMVVSATYEQITPYKKDLRGNERKNMPLKESYGVLKVTAKASLEGYTKTVSAYKDIKVVRVVPPFPEFSLFVRDGGSTMANYNADDPTKPFMNYNVWPSYYGGKPLNLKILSGLDATKTGKILFGGGTGALKPTQIEGFDLLPKSKEFGGRMPIILNLANISVLNQDDGGALNKINGRATRFPLDPTNPTGPQFECERMYPSFDFYGMTFADPKDGTKTSNMAEYVNNPLPPRMKLMSFLTGNIAKSGNTTDVELKHRTMMIGMGHEIGVEGEEDPFGHEKTTGYLNYFENYIKFCKNEDRGYVNPLYAGLELFGADLRAGRDPQKVHVARVYGNVFASFLQPIVYQNEKFGKDDAVILPWYNFDGKDAAAQSAMMPKKFYKEKSKILNLSFDPSKLKAGFVPQFGVAKKKDQIDTPPEFLGNAYIDNNGQKTPPDDKNIAYRHIMSTYKLLPHDVFTGKGADSSDTIVPFDNNNVSIKELTEKFPLDLAPEMAAYSFANAKDFIYNRYYMKKLIPPEESPDKNWHIYLDGIWYLEGMKAFEDKFQQLRLPPDAPSGSPLYINGKGVIASIFGTDILLNGIMKDENADDNNAQVSFITAPNPLHEKISKLPEEIRNTIFSSQAGDIWVTDAYVQASICAGIGTLRYKDNSNLNSKTYGAPVFYPFHGPDSKKDDRPYHYDSFYIRGNLVTNYLNLRMLEDIDPSNKNKKMGGGTVAYDESLFPERTGKGDADENYTVNMSQCYTFYKIEVTKDGKKTETAVE